jgi:hypothetical protein
MAPILGRTTGVGLGKETTAGTAVAPTVWIPQQELTVEDRKDVITDNSALGTRYAAFAQDTDLERAEGNLNGVIYDQSFGHIALAAMGSVSTAAHPTATGVNVHSFNVANTLPSYTIAKKDANESVRHAYSVLNTLEITVEQGNYASYSSSWLARKSATAANTVAYVTENRFRPQDVSVYVADDVASLDGATASRFRSLTLTINNNLFTEPVLGTVNPEYYPGVVETSISFGKLYVDTTFKDMVFGNEPKALRIVMERADVEIGTGTPTNPRIEITFQPGFFSEWNREGGLDDLKSETVSYAPIFSTTASKQFDLKITNTETSY